MVWRAEIWADVKGGRWEGRGLEREPRRAPLKKLRIRWEEWLKRMGRTW